MSQPPYEAHESNQDLPRVDLPKLDAEPGPAAWLSQAAASALVSATVREHQARRMRTKQRMWQIAAGVGIFFGLSAAVSATLLMRQAPPPSAAPRPSQTGMAAPAHAPAPEAAAVIPDEKPKPEPSSTSVQQHPSREAASATLDALAHANHLRSQGQWQQAARAYRHAINLAPRSTAAYAAMVAAASLYQEKLHQPERALELFLRAINTRPSGALSEEARWGVAQAYRQMGRSRAEVKALQTFLRQHPQSPFASQARLRLQKP